MYIQVSQFKQYVRVRIVKKVLSGTRWKVRLIEHVGSARSEAELSVLRAAAEKRIASLNPQLSLLGEAKPSMENETSRLSISGSLAYGLWAVMGSLYDAIGLPDELLKYLVLARVAVPKSKLATVRYLEQNLGLGISVSAVYKYMDRLDKESLMPVILAHAQKRAQEIHGQNIAVVFYDVTTLYFETDEEDIDGEAELGLRKLGYSKDHRGDLPQVVIGLTVDAYGFPIDFQVYEGNVYEGHTLLEGIRRISLTLSLSPADLTVVADAGMLSRKNVEELETLGYRYIVGARLKSLGQRDTKQVLDWKYKEKGTQEIPQGGGGRRLIVTYSEKRAIRSQKNRGRLIKKLQAGLDRGQVVRKSKYITLGSEEKLTGSINQKRLDEEECFDGLKGYVTNTALNADEVVQRYGNLWNVEKSFRMSKSDLQARPTFHYRRKRILSHLLICVCSLAVLREFERQLKQTLPETGLSIAIEELLAIRRYVLHVPNQPSVDVYSKLSTIQEKLLEIQKT